MSSDPGEVGAGRRGMAGEGGAGGAARRWGMAGEGGAGGAAGRRGMAGEGGAAGAAGRRGPGRMDWAPDYGALHATDPQGMGTAEMAEVARCIRRVLKSESGVDAVRAEVAERCRRFPADGATA